MTTNAPAGSSAAAGSSRRLQQTQNQVDEVVDIMRVNVDKVLERDQKLSELDDRADALQAGASQFETSAAKLKRKYWWKNCKMWAIGITVVVIIIIIIVVWSISSWRTSETPACCSRNLFKTFDLEPAILSSSPTVLSKMIIFLLVTVKFVS